MTTLFFFIRHISTKLYTFTPQIYEELLEKSSTNPFLTLTYSEDEGITSLVRSLASRIATASELGIDVIDISCDKEFLWCSKANLTQYPLFRLIKGDRKEFKLDYNGDYTFSELHTFIRQIVSPTLVYIETEEQKDSIIEAIENNPAFIFYFNEQYDDLAKNLSTISRFINATFYVIRSADLKFQVYTSPYCIHEYHGSFQFDNMTEFMLSYPITDFHEFTYDEFIEYKPDQIMIPIVSVRPYNEDNRIFLKLFSQTICGKYVTGFINPFSDRRFNYSFNAQIDDPIYLSYIDRSKELIIRMMKPLDLLVAKKFIINVTHYLNQDQNPNQFHALNSIFLLLLITIFITTLTCHSQYQKLLNWLVEVNFKGNPPQVFSASGRDEYEYYSDDDTPSTNRPIVPTPHYRIVQKKKPKKPADEPVIEKKNKPLLDGPSAEESQQKRRKKKKVRRTEESSISQTSPEVEAQSPVFEPFTPLNPDEPPQPKRVKKVKKVKKTIS